MSPQKAILYRTARVANDYTSFSRGEYVSIRFLHVIGETISFACSNAQGKKQNLFHTDLTDFCL